MLVIGLAIFCVCFIYARYVTESSHQHLSTSQKANLFDHLSVVRKIQPVVLLPAFVLLFFMHDTPLRGVAALYLAVALGALEAVTARRLRTLVLPLAYLRNYYRGRVIAYVGFFALFVVAVTATLRP